MKEMTPLEELRHSAAHILATAVLRLFPDARLDIGPPTGQGFYYDFDLEHKFTQEDLERLEAEMAKVIKENQPFIRKELSRGEAEELFRGRNQPYKLERLADIPEGEPISTYQNGDFIDLCAGTHVRYTKQVKAVKLLSIAGAYYRGDEKNKQLQRIYGTAFPSKEELENHLQALEEARQRDHRKLGREMRLFLIDDEVGAGMVLWTPRGSVIRQELQGFISDELYKQGYSQVFSPHIGKLDLFRTSGHYPYYRESQFPPIVEWDSLQQMAGEQRSVFDLSQSLEKGEAEGFLLKPMNCPFHVKLYSSQPRSYRDLPVRLAEFGTVYRWEQSGELNGMTRVRGFTQDDAHIFCTEDQLADELLGCLSLVKIVLTTLGMSDYRVRIGLRDPDSQKYIGDSSLWDKAEEACRNAASHLDLETSEEPGEAAFYGPKIDFVVRDVIGREWQLGTIQVDYTLPERFSLSYIGSDNQHHQPVMIHRAPFGSLERFVGLLIEHFAGNFPTWLAPEQVRVCPISDKQIDYARKVQQTLRDLRIRTELDAHSEKLGAKIRRAELEKVPYVLVVGAKEEESGQVAVRSRLDKEREGTFPLDSFVEDIQKEIAERRLPAQFRTASPTV